MGSSKSEKGCFGDETQHESRDFPGIWMQTTPVTQGEWLAVIGNNPSHFKGDLNRPVETVSWFDAVAFCNALSRKEGFDEAYTLTNIQGCPGEDGYTCSVEWKGFDCNGYRLPTEAEWEYAYRAGTTTAFYNGDCLNPMAKMQTLIRSVGTMRTQATQRIASKAKTEPVGPLRYERQRLGVVLGLVWHLP